MVANTINTIIKKQHFPRPFLSVIKESLHEPGKLFASQSSKGHPIVDKDSGLWPLAVIVAHATASGTGVPGASIASWRSVAPTAAAAELLGLALDIIDDIQDEDGTFIGKVGVPISLNLVLALLELVHIAIDDPQTPESLRDPLHSMFTSAILAATKGQFLDLSYEQHKKVTLDDALTMTALKSGSLTSLLYQAGAFIGASAKVDLEHALIVSNDFAQFGHTLGIIAQLENDWQDVRPSASAQKSDRKRGKKTLPLVFEADLTAMGQFSSDEIAASTLRFTRYHADIYRVQALDILNRLITSYGIPAGSLYWLLEWEASS